MRLYQVTVDAVSVQLKKQETGLPQNMQEFLQ